MKSLILSLVLIFSLIGCNSSSSNSTSGNTDSSTDESTTGGEYTVVDPYIKDATFFWDKNDNGTLDDGEPLSTTSDENGNFGFAADVIIPEGEKLVMYDKGEHNGVSYTGKLEAYISDSKVISPLTTLKAKNKDSISNILTTNNIDIEVSSLDDDPMKSDDPKHITASIAVDMYLKLKDVRNLDRTNLTLDKANQLIEFLIQNDIDISNIQDTVSISDYIVQNANKYKKLDEFNKFFDDENYRNNAKNELKNRDDKTKPGQLEEDDGKFRSIEPRVTTELTTSFSKYPQQNESTELTILDDLSTGTIITWSISEQPQGSSLSLSKSYDNKSVTFTPSISGEYILEIETTINDEKSFQEVKFTVKENYPIDESKIEGITENTNLSTYAGVVSNQSWIASNSLDEQGINDIINQKSSLTSVSYDTTKGVLVQYDDTSTGALEQLEELKYEQGIDNVFNRVYIGEDAIQFFRTPNDNGSFTDGGSNWHHEVIESTKAWDITTGSDDILIGVCDSGYDNLHADMQGRFATFLSTTASSHGMGVAGSIAANTDNGIGISGLNWQSDIVACVPRYMSDIETTVDYTTGGKETVLLTNSWGLGYLPNTFDPINPANMFEYKQSIFAPLRQIVQTRTDKLFLWAAGNGVGNGQSFSGYWGVDARYENGAMQYSNSVLNKLDNLLIVAAVIEYNGENVLRHYSDYGKSVDLAAPTEFDSLNLNNQLYSSFGGTSAATPVAAGVASLIYSINPNFTAAQVKDILIQSANGNYITKRQKVTSSSNGFPTAFTLETLDDPIPFVNAYEAVRIANEIVNPVQDPKEEPEEDNGVSIVDLVVEISDHFIPKATIRYFSLNDDYKVTNIVSTIKKSSTNTDNSYTNYTSKNSSSDNIEISLDTSYRYYEVTSTLTLTSLLSGETITKETIDKFNYSDVTLTTVNFKTGALVKSADVNIKYDTIYENIDFDITTDSFTAKSKIYLPFGYNKFEGSKSGFKNVKRTLDTREARSYELELPFGEAGDSEAGSVSGVVLNEKGEPLEGAKVNILNGSDEIDSTLTNENGEYTIPYVEKVDSNGNSIGSFQMTASLVNHSTTMKQNILILDAIVINENFTLIENSENLAPVANIELKELKTGTITSSNITISEGDRVKFSAKDSYDPEGYALSYAWHDSFTDSEISDEEITYNGVEDDFNLAAGTHIITLIVKDNLLSSGTATITITVSESEYFWDSSSWTDCEGRCDSTGTQTRDVVCKSNETGLEVDESLCTSTKPDTVQSCSMPQCTYDTIESNTTGRIWLDKNLGASKVCDKSLDEFETVDLYNLSQANCFGDYYQWGRDKDGHEYLLSSATDTISTTITPNHSKLILGDSDDWSSADVDGEDRTEFWELADGNGICPSGFRVPTISEIEAENMTDISVGYEKLRLPVAGYRSTTTGGTQSNNGISGVLWSSTVYLVNGEYESFKFNYYSSYSSYGVGKRVNAFPIRCINDNTPDCATPINVNAGQDQTITIGETIYLNGSAIDENDSPLSYLWKGGDDILLTTQNGSINSSTLEVGVHTLTLTVTNNCGMSATDSVTITVEDSSNPIWVEGEWGQCIANIPFVDESNNGTEERTVVCKDGDTTVSDDMCTAQKPATKKACTKPSGNISPIAKAGSDSTITYCENPLSVNGSSSSDSDGDILTYQWMEYGAVILTGISGDLPTLSIGTHTITLRVTDNEGAIGEDKLIVSVTACATPPGGGSPSPIWKTTSWTDCIGNYGSNNGSQTRTVTCVSSTGATLNDSSCTGTKPDEVQSCTASVCPPACDVDPTANAGEDKTIEYGNLFYFDGVLSSDDDYIVNYTWKEGDTELSKEKRFLSPTLDIGVHTITLTVEDSCGLEDSDTVDIAVTERTATEPDYWDIGAWTECSGDCGLDNGTKTRTIVCKSSLDDSVVSDSLCSSLDPKPSVSESCTVESTYPCTDTIVSPVTGRVWLNKNLGADDICTSFDDQNCFGDYYQWGRDTDGHEKTTSSVDSSISNLIDAPTSSFITSSSAYYYDWTSEDKGGTQRSSNWFKSDDTGICPDGFRVPTIDEINNEDIQSSYDAYSKLKLPAAGERTYEDGSIENKTILGGIWSTASNGDYSGYRLFSVETSTWSYHSRAMGRSVRCIKGE
ncbi:MAG: thrombospondin type-1 domain-containing protein [Campylobacterota bacterium]|nr:thrombospondin type-1 domain-containing protein [Campylobacterota bacterium]